MAQKRRGSILDDEGRIISTATAGAANDSAPPYVQVARQQMAESRARLASGNGQRTMVGETPLVAGPRTTRNGMVLLSDAAKAGIPTKDAVTSTPQGQTLIAGPNRGGYDVGQDARANAVNAARPPVAAPAAPTAAVGPQSTMQPVAGGTGYKPIEAGTIGDPNKPGAHRVVITGPNSYETRMTIPWRDEEGVYGKKGAVYNVDSVIGHQGSPHSHPNFFPNPDYAAQVSPPTKPGVGGFSMVGGVAGAPEVPDKLAPQTQPEKVGGVNLAFGGRQIANFGGEAAPQASGIDLSASNLTGMKPVTTGPETAMSPVDRLATAFPRGGMPAQGVDPTRSTPAPVVVSFGGGSSNQAQDAAAGAATAAGVSNAQAARIQTPNSGNPRPETETSPALDINKTDQSSAGFLGGSNAANRTPYVPPPLKPPDQDNG